MEPTNSTPVVNGSSSSAHTSEATPNHDQLAHAHAGQAAPTQPEPQQAELNKEIDDAMAALGFGGEPVNDRAPRQGGGGGNNQQRKDKFRQAVTLPGHDIAPIGGPAKAALKGPRVVTSGREHRTATIVSVGPTDIFLEFGPKELGILPRAQFKEGEELPAVGSQFEVAVDKFEPTESIFVCSRPGTVVKAAWESLEIGQTVEGKVVGVNKGGLDVEVAGHRAFMPASQVSLDRIPDLAVMIGEKLTCQVSQLDKRGRGNIILSRRDILEQERQKRSASLKDTLKEGDTLDGTVRKIMPFGAFVDVGGVDGLVHLSDLTHDRTGFGEQAVAKLIKEGQQIKVRVLKIEWNEQDMRKSRISLGVKQLAADPFQSAVADIKENADIAGRITRLAEFGAFVELAPGVEGLVHVSEIAHKRINHPQDVLKADEIVQVRVLKIDPATRRISLSIKALTAAPERSGGKDDRGPKRTAEDIQKDTPALRRLRAAAALRDKNKNLKGGF